MSTFVLWLALTAAGCHRAPPPNADPREQAPGGETTTSMRPFASLERPASNLPQDAKSNFYAGRALARQPWVKAPTTTDARDGLGPLYNARTCLACHVKGGRGFAPDAPDSPLTQGLVRLSIPGVDAKLGAVPEPSYGLQLQTQSTALAHQLHTSLKATVPAEGSVHVSWQPHELRHPDGHVSVLRRPELAIKDLGYGPLHPETRISLRVAPAFHGMGLIAQIDARAIEALADPEDRNADGVSGRINHVWDFRLHRQAAGRFGYKANRASLEIAVAAAFAGDLGISNSLFPDQPCSSVQQACQRQPHGEDQDGLEISDALLALVVDYVRNLGVPQRRSFDDPDVRAGRALFREVGCALCHRPRFETMQSTAHPHLSKQVIWPYSDFLLHDMGPDLADGRPDYEASDREWRTAPLWAAGLTKQVGGAEGYLHDGRARTLEEAVLWHGGEASAARTSFVALPEAKRRQLLLFVGSL